MNEPGSGPVSIAWMVPLPRDAREWTGIPAIADGHVLAEAGGGLRAYDLATGQTIWQTALRTGVLLNSRSVAVAGGRAFSAGGDSVFAVDAATGARLWAFLPDAQAATCEIAADADAVYIGTRSHRVYALDARTGAVRWVVDVGESWTYFGIVLGVSIGGDAVYVGAAEDLNESGGLRRGHVIALDRATGSELWRSVAPGDRSDVSGAPTVTDESVLVSDLYGGHVYALNRSNGQEIWRVAMSGIGPSRSPLVEDGVAYAGANDRHVYAFDLATGRVLWKVDTGGSVSGLALCGSLLLANNQLLFAINRDGQIVDELFTGLNEDFLWSDFAVADGSAFVLGNRGAYGLRCR